MQIQCHIVLYLPDYHVNTHRVCSTFWQLCEGADFWYNFPCENCTSNIAKYFIRSTNSALLQNCPLAVGVTFIQIVSLLVFQAQIRIFCKELKAEYHIFHFQFLK